MCIRVASFFAVHSALNSTSFYVSASISIPLCFAFRVASPPLRSFLSIPLPLIRLASHSNFAASLRSLCDSSSCRVPLQFAFLRFASYFSIQFCACFALRFTLHRFRFSSTPLYTSASLYILLRFIFRLTFCDEFLSASNSASLCIPLRSSLSILLHFAFPLHFAFASLRISICIRIRLSFRIPFYVWLRLHDFHSPLCFSLYTASFLFPASSFSGFLSLFYCFFLSHSTVSLYILNLFAFLCFIVHTYFSFCFA
jgi:hypothetical protein